MVEYVERIDERPSLLSFEIETDIITCVSTFQHVCQVFVRFMQMFVTHNLILMFTFSNRNTKTENTTGECY